MKKHDRLAMEFASKLNVDQTLALEAVKRFSDHADLERRVQYWCDLRSNIGSIKDPFNTPLSPNGGRDGERFVDGVLNYRDELVNQTNQTEETQLFCQYNDARVKAWKAADSEEGEWQQAGEASLDVARELQDALVRRYAQLLLEFLRKLVSAQPHRWIVAAFTKQKTWVSTEDLVAALTGPAVDALKRRIQRFDLSKNVTFTEYLTSTRAPGQYYFAFDVMAVLRKENESRFETLTAPGQADAPDNSAHVGDEILERLPEELRVSGGEEAFLSLRTNKRAKDVVFNKWRVMLRLGAYRFDEAAQATIATSEAARGSIVDQERVFQRWRFWHVLIASADAEDEYGTVPLNSDR